MMTIYVPTLQEKKTRCANQIEDVCKEVEKTIKQTIQNNLNSLEKDTDLIVDNITEKLKKDRYLLTYISKINFFLSLN